VTLVEQTSDATGSLAEGQAGGVAAARPIASRTCLPV